MGEYPVFESFPSPERHPARLAILGKLFSLSVSRSESARILEIACGTGANLIPFAAAYPQSSAVGLDISKEMIARANQDREKLKLGNVEFLHGDIAQMDKSLGQFDYIICHGLYSWAAPQLQQSLLSSCALHLKPSGLALISFNSMPGWYSRSLIREALLLKDHSSLKTSERIANARSYMKVIAELLGDSQGTHSKLLKDELQKIETQSDAFVLQELLAKNCEGCTVTEFSARCAATGLQYLTDARNNRVFMDDSTIKSDRSKALELLQLSLVEREQLLDFAKPRPFRSALLCLKEQQAVLSFSTTLVKSAHCSSALVPVNPTISCTDDSSEEFFDPQGFSLEVKSPIEKAALLSLQDEWPGALHFDELWRNACSRCPDTTVTQDTLADRLLEFFKLGFLELWDAPLALTRQASNHPRISGYARVQLERGNWATNQRHEYVVLDEGERSVAQLLDGSRSSSDLQASVILLLKQDKIGVRENGQPVTDSVRLQELAEILVEGTIKKLARSAMLTHQN